MITGLTKKYTKKGELMAVFTLEDLESAIEVMVFPKTMTDVGYLLRDDVIVAIRARLDDREDIPKLIAMDVKRLEINLDGGGPPVRASSCRTAGPEARGAGGAPRDPAQPSRGLRGVPPLGRQVLRLPGDYLVAPRPVSSPRCGCCLAPTPCWPEPAQGATSGGRSPAYATPVVRLDMSSSLPVHLAFLVGAGPLRSGRGRGRGDPVPGPDRHAAVPFDDHSLHRRHPDPALQGRSAPGPEVCRGLVPDRVRHDYGLLRVVLPRI